MNTIENLKNCLAFDNYTRTKAECELNKFKLTAPNTYMKQIGDCCRHSDLTIRKISLMNFHKFFMEGTTTTVLQKWKTLSEVTQTYIKSQILLILQKETNPTLKRWAKNMFCDLIMELWVLEDRHWPNLTQDLWKLFLSENNNQDIVVAFEILGILIEFNFTSFKNNLNDIFVLFEKGLIHTDPNINKVCINAFSKLIQQAEKQTLSNFKQLVPTMILSIQSILQKQQNNIKFIEEAISDLNDAIEAEAKFFASNAQVLMNAMNQIVSNQKIHIKIKMAAISVLLSFAKRVPKVIKKSQFFIDQLVEMICFIMIQISPNIDELWSNPPQNHDILLHPDSKLTEFGKAGIDSLFQVFGYKIIDPILSIKIQQLLSQPDWRSIYSAIMALSQEGEYIEPIQAQQIIQTYLPFIHNSNPKIRFATIHLIGQFADDQKQTFKEQNKDLIMEQVIARFQKEEVPRVQAHLLAMLTNLLDNTQINQYYFTVVYQYCMNKIQSGISYTVSNAINCLASLSGSCPQLITQQLNEFIPALIKNIYIQKNNQTSQQFIGQIIECLTVVLKAVEFQDTLPYRDEIITLMIGVQLTPYYDNQEAVFYVLSGWLRLCENPNYILPYLKDIAPYIFSVIKSIFNCVEEQNKQENFQDDCDLQEKTLNIDPIKSLQLGLSLLVYFNQIGKQDFFPFIEQCEKVSLHILSNNNYESVYDQATNILVTIVENQTQNQTFISNNYIQQLISRGYFVASEVLPIVTAISRIINIINMEFLTLDQVYSVISYFIDVISKSEKRIRDSEYDEERSVESINSDEEQLQIQSIDIFDALLKTHLDKTLLCQNLLVNIKLPGLSKDSYLPKYQIKFTLCMIDSFIEYIGFPKLEFQLIEYAEVLNFYAKEVDPEIRQAAVYGIGQLAKMQKDVYSKIGNTLNLTIQLLIETNNDLQGEQKEKNHCLDNVYSALGLIIFYQPESLGDQYQQLFVKWLYKLPLKYDTQEGIVQCKLLMNMINQKFNATINSSLELIQQIFHIFSQTIWDKNYEEVQQQSMQLLCEMLKVPIIYQQKQYILDKVSQMNKQKMQTLLNI